jgi:predicted MFS family arabinose efflux permease
MSRWTWLVILFSRVMLNLGVRVTYPFLPAIARGLGITFEQAGLLVSARHLVGLTGPFWGVVSDRKGSAWGMIAGLVFLLCGALTVSFSARFPLVLGGFVFLGLAKSAYDPNVQAFVSARVPYSLRARAIGILETAWAGSWLLGIPLSGVLIAHFGWHSPFVLLSGAALLAMLGTGALQEIRSSNSHAIENPRQKVWHTGNNDTLDARPALILVVTLFMVFANENMVIVYGAWLEKSFQLRVQSLGFFSILVGLAELAGEFTVATLVDRIGKRRAILVGLALTGLSYLALPFCQQSMLMALLGLTTMFYLFEFTIVSIFPYVSELVPARRGTWLALNYTFAVVGRLAGSLAGPWLWQRSHDLLSLAVVSLAGQALAVFLLMRAGAQRPAPSA